jgi:hypothetical protein
MMRERATSETATGALLIVNPFSPYRLLFLLLSSLLQLS